MSRRRLPRHVELGDVGGDFPVGLASYWLKGALDFTAGPRLRLLRGLEPGDWEGRRRAGGKRWLATAIPTALVEVERTWTDLSLLGPRVVAVHGSMRSPPRAAARLVEFHVPVMARDRRLLVGYGHAFGMERLATALVGGAPVGIYERVIVHADRSFVPPRGESAIRL